jgi:anti-sigma factor RsiW
MGARFDLDPCAACEEVLQPYLDRQLNEDEYHEAEAHLQDCTYCARRYRFEVSLRQYIRIASSEEMAPELKQRLQALRTPLI